MLAEAVVLGYIVRLQIEHAVELNRSEQAVRELNRELSYTSLHDLLTDLPNRQNLYSRMEQITADANRRHSGFAVMFLDLDHFKNINDTPGHDIGDKLLQSVAQGLKQTLRENDLITRIGGDEFIIIVSDITERHALRPTVEKILGLFRREWIVQRHPLRLSASIGIAVYPDDAADFHTLMKYADIAMYKAKEQGRNNFSFFTPALDVQVHEEVTLINEMHRAFFDGEFRLYYQPKVDSRTGLIIGAEALVRWEHPDKGLIHPGQFIHLAENTGFILRLGSWIIEETGRCLARLQAMDCGDLHLSVNVSVRQFQHADLLEEIHRTLSDNGVSGVQFAVEITESLLMESSEKTLALMQQLKSLGVHVCLDDFGTGYSSLSYLKRFPIDSLKIDKLFIDDIKEDRSETPNILNTIIAMGQTLGMHTIAEGVEHPY